MGQLLLCCFDELLDIARGGVSGRSVEVIAKSALLLA